MSPTSHLPQIPSPQSTTTVVLIHKHANSPRCGDNPTIPHWIGLISNPCTICLPWFVPSQGSNQFMIILPPNHLAEGGSNSTATKLFDSTQIPQNSPRWIWQAITITFTITAEKPVIRLFAQLQQQLHHIFSETNSSHNFSSTRSNAGGFICLHLWTYNST